jgi:threonine dehydrogenase-like Zn-dependent dehydrogenase
VAWARPAFSYFGQKVLGHYGSLPEHVLGPVSLVRHHRLDLARSVTATMPLTDAAEGVARLERKEGSPTRLVLMP